jgi:3-hydroxyisobutyrate dehydrogenase-like beta-hydroxyacid dehydrogenase
LRIAFIGLGHMGLPMARNLLGPMHTVTVYNRTPGRAKSLVAQGAKEATSVAEAVNNAEVAITMLLDDIAVNEVVHGPGGLILNLPPKAIHLCMGTIEVETSSGLAAAHTQAGQGYVAAPVFGRASAAASRHLWFVAGGMEPQVNRCRPIFEALGQGYTRVGPHAAQAHALKLGGNLLAAAMKSAVADILIFAKQAGLPPTDYLRFLNTAIFRSHMVDSYRTGTVRPSLDPDDGNLDLAANEWQLRMAKELGVDVPVADQLNDRIQAANARGWGERDLKELAEACRLETESEAFSSPASESLPDAAHPSAPIPVPVAIPLPAPAPSPIPVPVPIAVPVPVSVPAPVPIQVLAAVPVQIPVPIPAPKPPPMPAPLPVPSSEPMQAPEPGAQESRRATLAPGKSSLPKVRKILFFKRANPAQKMPPQAIPPIAVAEGRPHPVPAKPAKPAGTRIQPPPTSSFLATENGNLITLDLDQTSHFELRKGRVWAWSQGKPYETNWKNLREVEMAFNHILFLLINRHVLLRPDAVIEMRSAFAGRAKARVSGDMELEVSRSAVPRLRELLGI